MYTIVVDCMGSDNGPKAIIGGIKLFFEKYKDCKIVAVGKKEELEELKDNHNVEIVDARDVIPMTCGPLEVMRSRESSMYKAVSLMKEKGYDAVCSAGSTGAFLSCATIKLKLIDGVERACLVSPFPTYNEAPLCILDIGASTENNANQLVQFAKMGRIYSQKIMNCDNPNTYLLSNGTEDEKGTPEVKEAHKILIDTKFEGFKGNIEGREVLYGDANVVVAGGYAGNVLLKSIEGTAKMFSRMIKDSFKKNIFTMIGYLFAKKGFDDLKHKMDYKRFGGALLMGVNGVVVKGHGSSDEYSFSNTLRVAYEMVDKRVVDILKEGIKENANN